jgi:guanosine-3',5'-bis(diphosphate) 3'-pyrophosphohydrolase
VDLDALRAELLAKIENECPQVDVARVGDAYDLARRAHDGQVRSSGAPYLTHTVSTCHNVVDLLGSHLDASVACAALLHDAVEDTEVTLGEIESGFGAEVASLVDSVTKISGFHFYSQESEQAENFRKMLLSMAQDLRVIFIKLCDRLHNMQTVEFLSKERGERMARESRDIYAPLAHRLGIAYIKRELEDLALKTLDPAGYRNLVALVAQRRDEREKFLGELIEVMRRPLKETGVHPEIQARPKHFYSIYQKMNATGGFENIYDLYGVRIITRSKAECYQALGVVHDLWSPVQGRFKDYVATPKSNLYQSLHTTVAVPGGEMVEIQIRTREMHQTAETGVAAHYIYKQGGKVEEELDRRLGGFVSGTADWQRTASDDEYIDFLRSALYQEEVFAYTPKQELRRLPRGSTPLDFAYLIHTQVGHRCVGAKVNGSIVSLRYEIQNGDAIEVITSPAARPHQDWLSIVKTTGARSKIRHWLRDQHRADAISLGREMLSREIKRRQIKEVTDARLQELARDLDLADLDTLYSRLGQGTLALGHLVRKLKPEDEGLAEKFRRGTLDALRHVTGRPARGVSIQGIDNVLLRFAKCCQPVPGDPVTGVITQGRGITVHHRECPNTFDDNVAPERRTDVEWSVRPEDTFPVRLLVYGSDRPSLLADIAKAIAAVKVNIRSAGMAEEDQRVRGVFVIEVHDLRRLHEVMRAVRRLKGVTGVERQAYALDSRRRGG